jgi:hypothetical protein
VEVEQQLDVFLAQVEAEAEEMIRAAREWARHRLGALDAEQERARREVEEHMMAEREARLRHLGEATDRHLSAFASLEGAELERLVTWVAGRVLAGDDGERSTSPP